MPERPDDSEGDVYGDDYDFIEEFEEPDEPDEGVAGIEEEGGSDEGEEEEDEGDDESDFDELEEDLRNVSGQRVMNVLLATGLGLGVFDRAYGLGLDSPGFSFALRATLGLGATAASAAALERVSRWNDFRPWFRVRMEAPAVTAFAVVGGSHFVFFVGTSLFLWTQVAQFSRNRASVARAQAAVTDKADYLAVPETLPFVLEDTAEEYAAMVGHLSPDGSWTPEALARLALLADGEAFAEVDQDKLMEVTSDLHWSMNGEEVYYNASMGMWYLPIYGAKAVQIGGEEKTEGTAWDFANSHLEGLERPSQLDERSFAEEQGALVAELAQADESFAVPILDEAAMDSLSFWLPREWADLYRERIEDSAGLPTDEWVQALETASQPARDAHREEHRSLLPSFN